MSSDSTTDSPQVLLEIDQRGQLHQRGLADVEIAIATLSGGAIEAVPGPQSGDDQAIRFPAFSSADDYPRAVIAVTNAGEQDALTPAASDFSFGAEFTLDPISTSKVPQNVDNGDNLLQRGLSSDPAMFKLEIDGHRPACTVRGTDGTLIVRSNTEVVPGTWYRVTCARQGDEVTIEVTPAGEDPDPKTARSKTGTIGNVRIADPKTPLSVGGKLARNGAVIASATDQFNGMVLRPFFTVDS
ncbi:MAG: hypothetical protein HZY75_04705 [Nocardioidaceae bacterium]|nr:MAG: hypothetical protein HZY75_04705 [Nocardioidaceae bacterium]